MKHVAITAASAALLALAGVETAGVVASGPTSDPSRCDSWIGPGSQSVEGRPPDFQAATAPGTYIWHDCEGWHLRTLSTVAHGDNAAAGTMAIDGGRFRVPTGFHLSPPADTFTASDTNLRYHFHNDSGKDGLDFRISGESLTFHVQDSPGPAHAVYLGRAMQTPPSHTFTVYHVGFDGTTSTAQPAAQRPTPTPSGGTTADSPHAPASLAPQHGVGAVVHGLGQVRRFDHVRLVR